jgi:hypothetical protein
MRIEELTANSAGEFVFGPGHAFVITPSDYGAAYPLRLLPSGKEGERMDVDDDRVVWKRFTFLRAVNARPGSTWRVCVAETPQEAFTEASLREARPVRIFSHSLPQQTVIQGENFTITHNGAEANAPYVYDVRRYRQIMLVANGVTLDGSAGGDIISLFLRVYHARRESDGGLTTSSAYVDIGAGSVNNLATLSDPNLHWVSVGEGYAHADEATYSTRGMRVNYVEAKVSLNQAMIFVQPMRVELWGYP